MGGGRAPWEDLLSTSAITWVVAAIQMFYSCWRMVTDRAQLMDISITTYNPNYGYVFNWDLDNTFVIARFFSDVLSIIAAIVLVVGNGRRMTEKVEGVEYVRIWAYLTSALPCLFMVDLTLALLRWDLNRMLKTASR